LIGSAFEFGAVEVLPVLEVVEVNGVEDGAVVCAADGAEDVSAGVVVVVVSGDGAVEFLNGGGVEATAFFIEDPCFEFDVGGTGSADVAEELVFIEAEAVEDHLVVSGADGGVVFVEFTGGVEGGFEPEAREVEDAEGAGDAGGD
jgi:hypothetical protein